MEQQPVIQQKKEGFVLDESKELAQIFNTYFIVPTAHSFLLVNQQSAHERILYDQMITATNGKPVAAQRSMFPTTLELTPSDAVLLTELLPDLSLLGYQIEPFGTNSFVVQGTPADLEAENEKQLIDFTLEQYKHFNSELKISAREKLIRSLARQRAVKAGTRLTEREMRELLTNLFDCVVYNTAPDGNPTYLEFKQDQIERMFGR